MRRSILYSTFQFVVGCAVIHVSTVQGEFLQRRDQNDSNDYALSEGIALQHRSSTDPTDFSWVKKFAAVGDSFTAGIGSGNLYSDQKDDRDCSRYDYTYPVIISKFLGPSLEKFVYPACSGAISKGIFEQINALESGQDLVVMTAGGNDLCLVSKSNLPSPFGLN